MMLNLDWIGKSRRAVFGRGRRMILGAVAGLSLLAGGNVARGAGEPWAEDFFPIGVWSQPIYSFAKWKERGINTLMKYEPYGGQDSIEAWSAAANAQGLYQIRQPHRKLRRDLRDPGLLAWMHDDEPDYRKLAPSVLAQRYAKMKAVAPAKPVLVNFSGGNVINAQSRDVYKQYLASADWVSNDFYPVTGWGRPDWIDYGQQISDRKTPGMALKRLNSWSKHKPQFAIIETSNQRLPWLGNSRGVTPGELRAQVWHSIFHGARGIVYFPMQIGGGFRFDATPADVVEEMVAQNARIDGLAAVINSERGQVKWKKLSPQLEGMSRSWAGEEYFLVMNMSSKPIEDHWIRFVGLKPLKAIDVVGESRSLGLQKGYICDDFAPFELHVYQADMGRMRMLAVPEPGALGIIGLTGLLMGRRRRGVVFTGGEGIRRVSGNGQGR